MRLGLGNGLGLAASAPAVPSFTPTSIPGCVSRFAKPNYTKVGSNGTMVDSVAAHNATNTGHAPNASAGAPVFTGGSAGNDYLDAPGTALTGIAGAGGNGDHHLFAVFTINALGAADFDTIFSDDGGYIYLALANDAGNAVVAINEWNNGIGDTAFAEAVLGPSGGVAGLKVVVQAKKTGGHVWIRLAGGAWVQNTSPAAGALGITSFGHLFIGQAKITLLDLACWARALTSGESDQLATYGAALS